MISLLRVLELTVEINLKESNRILHLYVVAVLSVSKPSPQWWSWATVANGSLCASKDNLLIRAPPLHELQIIVVVLGAPPVPINDLHHGVVPFVWGFTPM